MEVINAPIQGQYVGAGSDSAYPGYGESLNSGTKVIDASLIQLRLLASYCHFYVADVIYFQ